MLQIIEILEAWVIYKQKVWRRRMTKAIKIFTTKENAVKFAEAYNSKISTLHTSVGIQYFVKYDFQYCPCDTCKHYGENGFIDPYGEPYCPIDHKCENASHYEKKGW